METSQNEIDPMIKKEADQRKLAASIQLAIELDSAFKLYSFRIIDADSYSTQVEDLIKHYMTLQIQVNDPTEG